MTASNDAVEPLRHAIAIMTAVLDEPTDNNDFLLLQSYIDSQVMGAGVDREKALIEMASGLILFSGHLLGSLAMATGTSREAILQELGRQTGNP